MKKKLFVYFGIVFIVGMLISSLLSFSVIKKEVDLNIKNQMITDVKLVSKIIELEKNQSVNDYIFDISSRIKEITDARFTLIEKDGKVVFDSEVDINTMENHSDRIEIKEALSGKLGISSRFSKTLVKDFLYVAYPVRDSSGINIVVRLSKPLTDIKSLIGKTQQELVGAFLIGLIISLIMGYSVAVYISRPLKKITSIANNIAKGDFSEQLYYKGNDEIKDLTLSFNKMAKKLGKTMGQLNHRNSNMASILDNVISGIIAVDKDEKVLFMNKAAAEYIGVKDHHGNEGQLAIKAIRDNGLDEFIKYLISNQGLSIEEMKFSRNEHKQFIVNGNPIYGDDKEKPYGYIIVIHDITEIKRLENIRTDFVANVSHELKTPLTSIIGFAETLKNGGIDDKAIEENFLGIILEEADRLQKLIDDILSLSEIESKKIADDEKFSVSQCIEEVVFMLESQAIDKSQMLQFEDTTYGVLLNANRNQFKQMLINLIENAIKYTPEKGKITVVLKIENNEIMIEVEDNGIGIPSESIDRIFERFYRVDKARSRELGGTGLGLSIVKHIVQILGGRIIVRSELEKGTKFTISVPKNI